MKIRAFPNPSGSAIWRLVDPYKALRKKGVDARVVTGGITPEVIEEGDIFVLQNIVDLQGIGLLIEAQREKSKKIVCEMDDWFELNEDNPHKKDHEVLDARDIMEATVGIADMVTTTTKHLANKISQINDNVWVLPNMMDMNRWDLPKCHPHDGRIRIGWAGSATHLNDLKMVKPILDIILAEFPEIELFLVGDPRMKDLFPGHPNVESLLGVPFDVWPTRLQGLRLDIGIAPLRDTEFNRCKSNIKFLEYSIAKVPSVVSDVVYGTHGLDSRKIAMVADTLDQWYLGLRNLIVNKSLREEMGSHAYSYVQYEYDLKRNIKLWEKAYASLH